MKRLLLLAFLSCVCLTAIQAQTTIDTALPLVEGGNAFTFENSTGENTVYYVYSAPADQGKLLTIETTGYSTSIMVSEDGTRNTSINGFYSGNLRIFPIKKAQTVYITASTTDTETNFTASLADADVEGGATCEDAIPATKEQFFVPCYYDSKTYQTNSTFISYNSTEDGLLEMTFGGYLAKATIREGGCEGTENSLTATSSSGSYITKYAVEAGKSYIVEIASYSPFMASFDLTHPVLGGSCDYAFTATATDNVLPKETGKYWYQYTTAEAGFMKITSDYSLAGGSISIYRTCNDYSAYATIDGYFAIRCEVYANTTYFICIEKTEATASDETFNIAVESLQEGDSFDNPIEITEGSYTVSQFDGTYYYKITVPEGDNRFLIVDATGANLESSSTKVNLYNSNSRYTSLAEGQDYIKAEVTGGTTYIIKWTCNEGMNGFSFTVSYEMINQGDVCSNPLEAQIGTNDLASGNVKYYQYTATQTGWLTIDTDITITVTFPQDCYERSFYDATKATTITKVEVTAQKTYFIKFSNIEDNTTFILAEEEYQEGEACEMAIVVEAGEISLPESVFNRWYQYTATQDGMLTVSSDITYEQSSDYRKSSMVSVKTDNCSNYANNIIKSSSAGSTFLGQFVVSEGDIIYINVTTLSVQTDRSLIISLRDLEAGESCSTPLPLAEGEFTFPEATRDMPVWYSITLKEGDFSVTSSSYIDCALYDNCETSSALATSSYSYNYESYTGCYALNYNVTTEGTYLLKLQSSYANTIATIAGTGIVDALKKVSNTNLVRVEGNKIIVNPNAQRTNVAIYDITGKTIQSRNIYTTTTFTAERGIYIVKVNDQVIKVAIGR